MPSTVWSACLLLIVTCIVVASNNHRLDLDDLLAYYGPLSDNFQSNEQMLDHLHYADISRPQNSQQDSLDVESNSAVFHPESAFYKPSSVSSLSASSLLRLLPKNIGADPLNENAEEEVLGSTGRWEPSQSLSSTDKRSGVDVHQRRSKPTMEYKRERNGGMGPSLSVDSSLDVIRQRFLHGLNRNRMMEKQQKVKENEKILSALGKREGNHASRSHIEHLSSH